MENNSLIPFNESKIRKFWHQEEWCFSVVDVIEILTDKPNPSRDWTNLKREIRNFTQFG